MSRRSQRQKLLAILALGGCLLAPAFYARAGILYSFEADQLPADLESKDARISLTPENGVTHGELALKVNFSNEAKTSGVAFKPARSWDWSSHAKSSLRLDFQNVGEIATHVYVRLTDRHGASQVRTACVPVGGVPQTWYWELADITDKVESGLRETPPAWNGDENKLVWAFGAAKLDLSQISELKIYTDTILHDRELVIDNVRISHNPDSNDDYLDGVADRYGQNAKADFSTKVYSDSELKAKAQEELAALAHSSPMPDRSKFGGWKDGPKLHATGYFRTEKVQDKWALVDPEGYLYFSTGIANVRMANTATMTGIDFKEPTTRLIDPEEVTPEDSRDFVATSAAARETRTVVSDLRRRMFRWLPEYNHSLADHYTYIRTVHRGAIPHGEAFSFYQANLERRYGESSPGSYLTKWRDVTVDRMLDWGFTSFGNWADSAFYQVDRVPYFANGWIIGKFKTLRSGNDYWSPMPDPFDPEFVRRARVTCRAIADEVQGSPWCVGVFVDNEKGWGRMGSFESQYGIVINALKLGTADSPTKAAFVRILQGKYETIDALNAAWDTSFGSWNELSQGSTADSRNKAMRADYSQLLTAYANEYFSVVASALEDVLPNHLYMGVRMAHWGLTPEIVDAAKRHSDVVSYNFYKEGIRDEDWEFLEEVNMPSIIGEFHFGATSDSGMYHPGIIAAADQADRARKFKEYMESVIDNPYFVGAHWFQYNDSPLTGRSYDGENYNIGFVTVADIPYPEMVSAAKEVNSSLYERRYGGVEIE